MPQRYGHDQQRLSNAMRTAHYDCELRRLPLQLLQRDAPRAVTIASTSIDGAKADAMVTAEGLKPLLFSQI